MAPRQQAAFRQPWRIELISLKSSFFLEFVPDGALPHANPFIAFGL